MNAKICCLSHLKPRETSFLHALNGLVNVRIVFETEYKTEDLKHKRLKRGITDANVCETIQDTAIVHDCSLHCG